MARIHFNVKAQQRFATVPVLDENGQQKVTVVHRSDGEPKKDKRGNVVTRKVTKADKSQPLPPYDCQSCGKPIEVGTLYKHVSIKSGPFGGRTLRRHQDCPTWRQSELTTSKMAGIYAAQEAFEDFLDSDYDSEDDVRDALSTAAEDIRAVAEEYRESADNIRDGFGHDTYQSEELDSKADEIESWADEIENADVPERSEEETDCDECSGTGEQDCDQCNGTGEREVNADHDPWAETAETETCDDCGGTGVVDCENCDGTGQVENDEDDLESWRDEVRDATSIVEECPV